MHPLIIENRYNKDYELWEVSMDGQTLGYYVDEDSAAELIVNVHTAFELGFINGVQLALANPGQAQESLAVRGIV